jgi:cholesterol oxidase
MGRDRSEGVVNHKCQVFDGRAGAASAQAHQGLYVMDGAVMPRSLGVNPLLTITAVAERAMLHLARDWGLACDDVPASGAAPAPVSVAGLE